MRIHADPDPQPCQVPLSAKQGFLSLQPEWFLPVLWIRFRIWISIDPDLFWSAGSGSGSRRAKKTHKKKMKKFYVLNCWMFSLRAEGISSSLGVLHVGQEIKVPIEFFLSKK
jgi:hypothetical protein